jgi:CRP/FNR family transcriptional regulator, cyclic AMP receptor protein
MASGIHHAPFDLLQWLPEAACADFRRMARHRGYGAGELIYAQSDEGGEMFRIVEGTVRLSVTRADGRELLYLLFEPGDCFGVSSLIDGEPRPQTAEASRDLKLQIVNKAAFDDLRLCHRAFDDALVRLATRHMRMLSGLFADASLQDMAARVASRILAVAHSFGRPGPDGTELSITISQTELAAMVGGARQTINKLIMQFRRDGLMSTRNGRIVIHSIEALKDRASGR